MDLPARLDCYYVHDLAVAPEARGRGAGRRLLAAALAIARERGFRTVASTASRESEPFWRAFGFREARGGPARLQVNLRELGPGVSYLILSGGF
jgi:GNAT superfamily N-acetyltransferase